MEPVEVDRSKVHARKRKRMAAVVVAVLAISTGVYLLTSSDTGTTVNITSITVYIGYTHTTDTFFGSPVHNVTANYETYSGGSSVVFTIPFHNSGDSSHSVTAIYTNQQGFTVSSENPKLPVSIDAGQTAGIQVHIELPNHNFAGNLVLYAVVK